ncbi:MAG: PD-(D/E)XK nuclease family transposase [Cyclobacteriaceae bacterium]
MDNFASYPHIHNLIATIGFLEFYYATNLKAAAAFPIQSQAPKGRKWDYFLKAVYTIGILNFSLPDQSGEERYQREIQLMDTETHEAFYDKLTFIYLEVPNFRKNEDELISQFDKWMYVLKNLHQLQSKPVKLQEKVFERLFNEAEIAKLKPEDMKAYEESLKVYRDNYSIIETAVNKKTIEIAREMKKDGHSIEMIAKYTLLAKEQIEKL